MWILETVAVAFGMYSALPTPRVEWNEKNMRWALAAFPILGVVQGLGWWGVCALSATAALPELLRGALLCVWPALMTGGIHLDGYADVSDALASHAEPARKREILHDSHIGAFAAIRLCLYFVVYLGLCCAMATTEAALWCMGLGFVLSRALSGLLLTQLSVAEGSSLARLFADAADKRRAGLVLGGMSAGLAAAMICLCGAAGIAADCAALLVMWRYIRVARREFGGVSGDLAGWFLVKAEFWMLAVIVAVQYGESVV